MRHITIIIFSLLAGVKLLSQSLYDFPPGTTSAVSSFENMNGVKGNGGKTNKGAKGNAFEMIKPGETKTLLNISGKGIIQRIWLTVNQSPVMLRSLRLQMFWDNETKAAVDVPLGDFFGDGLGRKQAYESALFSTAEGRSFNCYVPMPFQKAARITISNEGTAAPCKLYYDVDFIYRDSLPGQALYFHAVWSRQQPTLKKDVTILPLINGKGRFLGMSAALLIDSSYKTTWWGEGEVKTYVDGDTEHPTINGTGAEDYLGSGWGLGRFHNQYQGCTVADATKGEYSFYRFHIPDAVYFSENIKVEMQQIGGGDITEVKKLLKSGVKLIPVSIDAEESFYRLFDIENASLDNYTKGWVNFYRTDDYAITAYFYLDKPSGNLPLLADVKERIMNLRQ